MKSNNTNILIARVAEALELVGEAGGRRPGRTPRKRIVLWAILRNMLIPYPQPSYSPRMQVKD